MSELEMLWAYCPGEVIAYGAVVLAVSIVMAVCMIAWIGGSLQ